MLRSLDRIPEEEVLGEKIQCKNIQENAVRSCENATLRGKWSTPQKKRTWIIFLYEKNEKPINRDSKSALYFAKHSVYKNHIALVNSATAAKLTLTLGSHFGQDVALMRAFTLKTIRSLLEALCSATVYF